MATDRNEKFEGEEEVEYQFSDDEANYEMEPEATPKTGSPAPADIKQDIISKVSPYRRMIIGVVVFFGLIFIVYKMLAPTTPTQPTDFTQQTAGTTVAQAPTAPPTQPAQATPPAAPPPQQSPVGPSVATTPPSGLEQPPPLAAAMQQPGPVPSSQPTIATTPNGLTPPAQPPILNTNLAQAPAAPLQQPIISPPNQVVVSTNPPPPALVGPSTAEIADAQKTILDKLASLEDQNAKFMSLVQAQFAQKMSEYDASNKATQERVQGLSKRLSNMESSINKMAQMMQDEGFNNKPPSMIVGPNRIPPAKSNEPKMIYVVQAIIPGRAWLKSDTGDTVTVAEGDVLKDYGKITKIDPYDGVVEIDTGSKIIVLSYGSGGD